MIRVCVTLASAVPRQEAAVVTHANVIRVSALPSKLFAVATRANVVRAQAARASAFRALVKVCAAVAMFR